MRGGFRLGVRVVERAVVLLVDAAGVWWGMGPTLELARSCTVEEVERSMRSEYGEPPWETEQGWDTPDTLQAWVERLVAVRLELSGRSEEDIRLALVALFGPEVASEVLEELAQWRSEQPPTEAQKERRRTL